MCQCVRWLGSCGVPHNPDHALSNHLQPLAAVGMLLANYMGAVVLAIKLPGAFNGPVMVGAHVALALLLVVRTARLEAAGYTKEALEKFYRWIWVLFYSTYLAFPFI